MTYTIKVKDDSTEEGIIVICPSAISVKGWIYTQLLRAMREDIVYTHIDGRRIFGGAIKFDDTETNKLKQLDDERA